MAEDNKWIEELKAGDKVFVRGGFDDSDMNVHKVKKITPKGSVRLDNDELFKNGVCRKGMWLTDDYLVQFSDDKMGEIRVVRARKAHMRKLENVRWRHLKPEVVDAVYDGLKGAGVF